MTDTIEAPATTKPINHWIGGTPYAAYHSAADLPHVVQEAQLRRVGRLMWAWLSG